MSTLIPRGNIGKIFAVAVTFDPASIATVTTAEQTLTVTGVLPGDFIIPQKPTNTAGFGIVNARVSAANTIALTAVNPTAGAVNPGAETWQFLVIRPDGPLPTVFNA